MNLKEYWAKLDMEAARQAYNEMGKILDSMDYAAPEAHPHYLKRLAHAMNGVAKATCLVQPTEEGLTGQSSSAPRSGNE